MEVLFAIGVLLIGILGLASVIPMGVHQSADAVNFDKSMAALQNLVSETAARVETGTREGFVAPVTTAAGGKQTYFRVSTTRRQLRAGLCVDPWFLTAAENRRPAGGPDVLNGYNRAVFPCYDQAYNPLVAPSAAGVYNVDGSRNTGWFHSPAYSGNQRVGPRLDRVAVSHEGYQYSLSGAPKSKIQVPIAPTHSQYERQAVQTANPTLFLPKDDTHGPGRIFSTMGGNLVRPFSDARLSAMSLVQSDRRDPSQVRISTMVLERRIPVTNPGAADYTATPSPPRGEARFDLRGYAFNANTSPYYTGEQLMYVSAVNSQASFSLGVGGVVDVVMHRHVNSAAERPQEPPKFLRGQYILFMRNVYSPSEITSAAAPQRTAFDWFRIRNVLVEPEENDTATYDDPVHGTTQPVWHARLELQGPSWIFDDQVRTISGSPNFATVSDNTFAVYMPEVVAVFDRTITVQFD